MAQRDEKVDIALGDPVVNDGIASKRPHSSDGSIYHNGFAVSPKRLLGAYYTPDDLAKILVNWALARVTGTVLDPSFGGCSFLAAATRVLAKKGIKNPGRLVFGVDVDAGCVAHVRRHAGLVEENCIVQNFLDLAPEEVSGSPFQAIVGNPPYVRHHWLNNSMREAARSIVDKSGIDLPATASTWAYFLIHALDFLAEGGPLAMLVPEAILQTDYAAPIREMLANRFCRILLIHVRDRLFEGTDEPVVVVAASGYGCSGKITIESIERAEELEGVLSGSSNRRTSSLVTVANGRTISSATIDLLGELEQHKSIRRIADIATVRIGLVTGANSHFIRSARELNRLGIPDIAWLPVVARTRWLSGLEFTKEDHQELVADGRCAFLVRPMPKLDDHVGVQRWIEEGTAAGVHNRFKCKQRLPWFRVKLPPAPDAFATCTRLASPLLILNRAGYQCTNALHMMYWSSELKEPPELVAIGFLTSVVSVWAELHGRRYGGGVIKIEPGQLVQAPVPILEAATDSFTEINMLIRDGRENEARLAADRVILGEGLGLDKRDIRRLQLAFQDLMAQRVPVRRGGGRA